MTDNIGALAAALAKAQGSFATVTRDKTVTVATQKGSYQFSYAPLDSILAAVRKPLADNGLVVVQVLDEGALVTSLIHESGAMVVGKVELPTDTNIQGLGSAITYLRRYAIQALLGIAAEDDDDGNRSVGNQATERASETHGETVELLGKVDVRGKAVVGGSEMYKAEWRQTPDGWAIGFRLERGDDKDIPQVLIVGDIAAALHAGDPDIVGEDIRLKGRLYAVKQPSRRSYNRLIVGEADGHLIETAELRIPALPTDASAGGEVPAEAPSSPMFELTDDEKAAIAAGAPA